MCAFNVCICVDIAAAAIHTHPLPVQLDKGFSLAQRVASDAVLRILLAHHQQAAAAAAGRCACLPSHSPIARPIPMIFMLRTTHRWINTHPPHHKSHSPAPASINITHGHDPSHGIDAPPLLHQCKLLNESRCEPTLRATEAGLGR